MTLTETQRKEVETQYLTFRVRPMSVNSKPTNKVSRFAFRLLQGKLCKEKPRGFKVKETPDEK